MIEITEKEGVLTAKEKVFARELIGRGYFTDAIGGWIVENRIECQETDIYDAVNVIAEEMEEEKWR